MRTGAISLKKVWGEVNQADLFTKHLPSRKKVHQLLGLFGCECRPGRAEAAPLLRPLDVDGRSGGHSADHDPLPTYVATRSCRPIAVRSEEFHDESRLPHRHTDVEIDELFPTIEAAAKPDNVEDWQPDDASTLGGGRPRNGRRQRAVRPDATPRSACTVDLGASADRASNGASTK